MKSPRVSLWSFLVVISFLTISLFAQTPTGTVVGTITDSTGATLPNATITIRDAAIGSARTTVSSNAGAYEFTTLHPSTSEITVEPTSLRTATQNTVNVASTHVTR